MAQFDIKQVIAIEQQGHTFPWSEQIFQDCISVGYSCWVMTCEHEMVGFGVMSMAAGEAHILNITVANKAKRRGYGRALLLHLLEIARRNQTTRAFLEVRFSNDAAIKLYKKMGLSVIGVRKDYYPHENGREDALVLAFDF